MRPLAAAVAPYPTPERSMEELRARLANLADHIASIMVRL